MQLLVEDLEPQEATHQLIDQMLSMIAQEGKFMVLDKNTMPAEFVQVAFDQGCCAALEYCTKEDGACMYVCTQQLSTSDVARIFHAYLDETPGWMNDYSWRVEKPSFWEKIPWKAIVGILGVLVFIGIKLYRIYRAL